MKVARSLLAGWSKWLVLTGRGDLYNQMDLLFDWVFREIGIQPLHGIEFIRVRDFLASTNLPKCVSDAPSRKGIPELQNVSRRYTSVVVGTLRGRVHLPDFEFRGGYVDEIRGHHLLDLFLQVIDGF